MLYVALAAVAALVCVTTSLLGVVRALYRQHARERQLLIDQILHLTGKPWHEAPADTQPELEPREPRRWTATPEQNPVY